ncbi:MAG: hypothetical protein ACRCYO_10115 [Bacteroidia bacterium]
MKVLFSDQFLNRRFLAMATALLVLGLVQGVLPYTWFQFEDLPLGETGFALPAHWIFISAALLFMIPGLFLWLLEECLHRDAPMKLTRIQFLVQSSGFLILVLALIFLAALSASDSYVSSFYMAIGRICIGIGLVMMIAGVSLLPAVLMIGLRRE